MHSELMREPTVHEGDRYRCTDCGKSFYWKKDLKSHQKIVHEGERYECSDCDKRFSRKGNMIEHQKTVHE